LILKTKLFGTSYQFKTLKEVLAKANEEKSGDKLAGIAAETVKERIAAKVVLSEMVLSDLRNNPIIPYEDDEVTRVIQDSVNVKIYNQIKNWTVSELREYILSEKSTGEDIKKVSRGLTSEMIAAVTKLMSNLDLLYGASKININAHCNTTIGLPGTLSIRLQPNHPTDNIEGILISVMEGLSYGAGDALIGLNQ
jgi:ethanolamine ammonia-lyase large subunit